MRCRDAIRPPNRLSAFPCCASFVPRSTRPLADLVSEALIYDVERRIRDVDEMKHRLLAIRDGVVTAGDRRANGGAGRAGPARSFSYRLRRLPRRHRPWPRLPRRPDAADRDRRYPLSRLYPINPRRLALLQLLRRRPARTLRIAPASGGLRSPDHHSDRAGATALSKLSHPLPPLPGSYRVRHRKRSPVVTLLIVGGLMFLVLRLIFFLSSVRFHDRLRRYRTNRPLCALRHRA